MSDIFSSPFFGIALSILTFWIGVKLQKRLKSVLCNPLLIAILLTSVVLLAFDIPYESYNEGGAVINMFLTPATACLAVSIYTKIQILKKNCIPIVVGCTVGSLASMGSVWLLCQLFGLDEAMTASLIPKSITTPHCHGGLPVPRRYCAGDCDRGDFHGNSRKHSGAFPDPPVSGGQSRDSRLAIGACSHAVGTSRALELGETEGAMSGLAIGVCGIITVLVSMILL